MQEQFEAIDKKSIPELKCIGNNAGFIICSEKQCTQAGIMCISQKCQCFLSHQKCENQLQVKRIINKLLNGRKEIPKDLLISFELIDKSINQMIDQLSQVREQMKQAKQYFGLSKSERQFYSHLVYSNFEKLNGKLIAAIKSQSQQNQRQFWLSSQRCTQSIRQQKKKFEEICKKLNMLVLPSKFINFPSKITDDFTILSQWIIPSIGKPIKQFRLLYRASQNGFSAAQFHKKCDNIYNTLVLIRTNFGKIIGGFTPNRWNQISNNYYYDTNHKTFIFSLTDKQKMPQITTNGKYSIYCHTAQGPTFGGGFDIYICDKSNTQGGSYGNLGHCFNNGKFAYGNQQTHLAWIGCTNGSNFTTEQYEVYQVI